MMLPPSTPAPVCACSHGFHGHAVECRERNCPCVEYRPGQTVTSAELTIRKLGRTA